MVNLNSTDLLVRVQLLGCRLSVLSKKFADDLKYGKKCTIKDRETLLLLNIYLEILQCYNVLCEGDISSTGTIFITSIDNGTTIDILINGVNIGAITAVGTSPNAALSALADAINLLTSTSGVSATYVNSDPPRIDLIGPCDNPEMELNTSGGIDITIDQLTGGECTCGDEVTEEDNCFTEEEIQIMIGKIEDLADICFKPLGFTYDDN